MQRAPLSFVLVTSAVLGLAACSNGYTTYPTTAAAPAAVVPAPPAYPGASPVSSTGPVEVPGAPDRAPTATPQ